MSRCDLRSSVHTDGSSCHHRGHKFGSGRLYWAMVIVQIRASVLVHVISVFTLCALYYGN